MAVRIKDVARHASVSIATVSRVLADKPHVSPELRRRVTRAVAELGYQPNRVARTLRTQRATVLGILVSDIQNPFFTTIVRAVEDVAHEHGYAAFLCNTDEDEAKERLYLELMQAERVAGIVMTPTREDADRYRFLRDEIPIVTVDRRVAGAGFDSVLVDNVGGAEAAAAHLLGLGHRRVAAILPPCTMTTGRERREGFERAFRSYGLDPAAAPVLHAPGVEASGYRLTCELLDLPERPTALFAGSNLLTSGALRALRDRALRVPSDMAIAAFDSLDWIPLTPPDVHVVKQPTYELGRTAARMLLERIGGADGPGREIVLAPELRFRPPEAGAAGRAARAAREEVVAARGCTRARLDG